MSTTVEVKYAEGYTAFEKPVKRYGILQIAPGQSTSGYGSKISTDYMVRFPGEHTTYRVYAVCYSNVASHYIIRRGEQLYLRGYQLEEALGR